MNWSRGRHKHLVHNGTVIPLKAFTSKSSDLKAKKMSMRFGNLRESLVIS